ncbi:hypothetical protein ANN_09664, partial [Periplaneta americana]
MTATKASTVISKCGSTSCNHATQPKTSDHQHSVPSGYHLLPMDKRGTSVHPWLLADGLQYTRRWLVEHVMNFRKNGEVFNVEDANAIRSLTTNVLGEAYLELLDWNNRNPYPETLVMDQGRFTELGRRCLRLHITGSVLLVTASTVQPLYGIAAFKEKLKEHIKVLMEDNYTN